MPGLFDDLIPQQQTGGYFDDLIPEEEPEGLLGRLGQAGQDFAGWMGRVNPAAMGNRERYGETMIDMTQQAGRDLRDADWGRIGAEGLETARGLARYATPGMPPTDPSADTAGRDFVRGTAGSAVGALGSSVEGLGHLGRYTENLITGEAPEAPHLFERIGGGMNALAESDLLTPERPEHLSSQLGSGIGSMGAFLGTGLAGRALGAGGQAMAAGTMAGGIGSDEAYDRIKAFMAENPELGMTEEDALKMAAAGVGPGLTELANLNILLSSVAGWAKKGVAKKIFQDLGGAAVTEGLQEGNAQMLQNALERQYNVDRELMGGVMGQAGIAGLSALLMRGAALPYTLDNNQAEPEAVQETARRIAAGEDPRQVMAEIETSLDQEALAEADQRGEFDIDLGGMFGPVDRFPGGMEGSFYGIPIPGRETQEDQAWAQQRESEALDDALRREFAFQDAEAARTQGFNQDFVQAQAQAHMDDPLQFVPEPPPNAAMAEAFSAQSPDIPEGLLDMAPPEFRAGFEDAAAQMGPDINLPEIDNPQQKIDNPQQNYIPQNIPGQTEAPSVEQADQSQPFDVPRETRGTSEPMVMASGRPYRDESAARRSMERRGIQGQPVEVEGGWGIQPIINDSEEIDNSGQQTINQQEISGIPGQNQALDSPTEAPESQAPIYKTNGEPYRAEGTARRSMERRGIRGEVVPVEGGWVIQPEASSARQEPLDVPPEATDIRGAPIDRGGTVLADLRDTGQQQNLPSQAEPEGGAQPEARTPVAPQTEMEVPERPLAEEAPPDQPAQEITETPPESGVSRSEPESAREVSERWRERGITSSISERRGILTLNDVVVPEDQRGQGLGSEFMRDLTRYADRTGQRVGLTPSTDRGATSISRLQRFYRQFGFVPNRGKSRDFEISETMVREPEGGTQPESASSDPSPARYSRGEGIDQTAQAARILSGREELFQLPKPEASDMSGIFAELDPDITVEEAATPEESGMRQWDVTMPDGRGATLMENVPNREVWLDASTLNAGESGGRFLYAGAAAYAHNNGRRFVGDPNGLSESGHLRRTENLISSAIKYGTTRHLEPHQRQREQRHAWERPIQWRVEESTDDYFHNLRELLESSYHNVRTLVPEIEGISYNFERRRFENAEGNEFTESDFSELASRVRDDYAGSRTTGRARRFREGSEQAQRVRAVAFGEGTAPIGRTTLKRAALTNTLVQRASPEAWREVLAAVARQYGEGLDAALEGTYYSREAPAPAGVSGSGVSDVTGWLGLGRGRRKKLADSGLVNVVQSVSDIPGSHPADVPAAYHEGSIYLVADNIRSRDHAHGLLLHELGVHHGLQDMLGDDYGKIVDRLKAQVRRGERENATRAQREAYQAHQRALADETIAGDETALWEETIAYMAEAGARSTVVQRVIAAVKRFLRQFGLNKDFTATDLASMARGSVSRLIRGDRPAYTSDGTDRMDAASAEAARYSRNDTPSLNERLSFEPSKLPGNISVVDFQSDLSGDALIEGTEGEAAAIYDPAANRGVIVYEQAGQDAEMLALQQSGYSLPLEDVVGRVISRRIQRMPGSPAGVFGDDALRVDRNVQNALRRARLYLRQEHGIDATDDQAAWFLQGAATTPSERVVVRPASNPDSGRGREPGDPLPPQFDPDLPRGASPRIRDKRGRGMVWTRLFESAADNFEQTTGLEYMGQRIRDFFDGELRYKAEAMNIIRDALRTFNRMSRSDRQKTERAFGRYFQAATYGGDARTAYDSATPEARALIDAWKRVGELTGDMNQKLGVQVKDGKQWRLIGKAENYFPRMFSDITRATLANPSKHPGHWDALVDALMAEGSISSRDQAEGYIRAQQMPADTQNDFFSAMEMARKQALPDIFYDWTLTPALNYINAWATRYSQIEQFGQQTDAQKDMFDEALDSGILDEPTRRYIKAAQRRVYEYAPTNMWQQTLATLNMVATGSQLANFGTATLNLIGGSTLNWMTYGEMASIKAYAELIRSPMRTFRDMQQIGVLREDVLKILQDSGTNDQVYKILGVKSPINFSRGLAKAVNLVMKYGGYLPTEHVIRMHGALAGKHYLLAARRAYAKNPKSRRSKQFQAFIERNNFDFKRLMREDGRYFEKWLRFTSNLTQGTYRIDQTPIFADVPEGRFFLKYQKFGTQVNRLVWKESLEPFVKSVAGRGEKLSSGERARTFWPMVRYFYAAAAGGAAIGTIREMLFDYMRSGPEEDELEKALEDDDRSSKLAILFSYGYHQMNMAGAFGFLGNYGQMFRDFTQQERVKNPLDPPGLAALDAAAEIAIRLVGQKQYSVKDLDETLERFFSLYRTSKRPLIKAIGMMNEEHRLYKIQSAERDRKYIAGVTARYAKDQGIEGARSMISGRFMPTERTPVAKRIIDAIRAGDDMRAEEIFLEASDNLDAEEYGKFKRSIRASVRNAQPMRMHGKVMSRRQVDEFLEWAEQHVGDENLQRIIRAHEEYLDSAAGFM